MIMMEEEGLCCLVEEKKMNGVNQSTILSTLQCLDLQESILELKKRVNQLSHCHAISSSFSDHDVQESLQYQSLSLLNEMQSQLLLISQMTLQTQFQLNQTKSCQLDYLKKMISLLEKQRNTILVSQHETPSRTSSTHDSTSNTTTTRSRIDWFMCQFIAFWLLLSISAFFVP